MALGSYKELEGSFPVPWVTLRSWRARGHAGDAPVACGPWGCRARESRHGGTGDAQPEGRQQEDHPECDGDRYQHRTHDPHPRIEERLQRIYFDRRAVEVQRAHRAVAARYDVVRELGRSERRKRHKLFEKRLLAGYLAAPQSDDEGGWSDESTVGMIAAEPW